MTQEREEMEKDFMEYLAYQPTPLIEELYDLNAKLIANISSAIMELNNSRMHAKRTNEMIERVLGYRGIL